jgi:predicted nuclease with RNAse H fold
MNKLKVVGIDWAVKAEGRAAVVLECRDGVMSVSSTLKPVTDDRVRKLVKSADVAAIDTPFGWPARFSEFVAQWHAKDNGLPPPSSLDFRLRFTDAFVQNTLGGKWPLSVSSDRIASSAREWCVVSEHGGIRPRVDVVGHGPSPAVIEVYPAASLRVWCSDTATYKERDAVRSRLLSELEQVLPFGFSNPADRAAVVATGDDSDRFDALVAALTGAAYSGYLTSWDVARPAPEVHTVVKREGWIFFPVRRPTTRQVCCSPW